MDDKKFLFDLPEVEKKKQSNRAAYIYGSERRDRVLNEPEYLPRYAALGRKVLSYYGGEHYNPHTVDLGTERFIRTLIQSFIEKKVFYKQREYDWEYIDHFFRDAVGFELKINIPYDQSILDRGLSLINPTSFLNTSDTVN